MTEQSRLAAAEAIRQTIAALRAEATRLEAVLAGLESIPVASLVPVPATNGHPPIAPAVAVTGKVPTPAPASPRSGLAEKIAVIKKQRRQAARDASRADVRPDRTITLPAEFPTGRATLGLDFGTHSTKLVLRARNQTRAAVLMLDEPGDKAQCPTFAVPSLVLLKDGRLYFGRGALEVEGGSLFRSLKWDLLQQLVERNDYPEGTTPDLLVAAYLGWALGRVKAAAGPSRRLTVNVPVPMDHLEVPRLRERYLTVVGAAWAAAFGPSPFDIAQGADWAELRTRLEAGMEEAMGVSSEERQYFVRPETLAPIVSRAQDPRWQGGMHLMADMGAGTTEVSVSLITMQDGKPSIECYHDVTVPVGGDLFQANDERNQDFSERHAEAERGLIERLVRTAREVFRVGYFRDKDNGLTGVNLWRRLTLIFTGGGLRRRSVADALRNDNIPNRFRLGSASTPADWHRPIGLFLVGAPTPSQTEFGDRLPFLAVADGLSFERWPKFSYPGQVPELVRERAEDEMLQNYTLAND